MNFDYIKSNAIFNNLSNKNFDNNSYSNSNLVSKNVKAFLSNNLKKCNEYKFNYYNSIYNISMFLFFTITLILILKFRYKGSKKNKEYLKNKMIQDNNYIMSKLVYYNKMNIDNQQNIRNNLVTNLPNNNYNQNPEAMLLHNKIYN
tara:strand:- start:1426 stop:1863 length:438 start_codon:yes stop_codon:yes gene_type:complete